MENLQKLEEFLNLANANGGFRSIAQSQQAANTLQAVVKDFQSLAAEVKRLKDEYETVKATGKE